MGRGGGSNGAFLDDGLSSLPAAYVSSSHDIPPDSYGSQDDNDDGPTLDRASITMMSREHASVTLYDTPKAGTTARDFPKAESVKVQGKSIMTTMGLATIASDDWIETDISNKLDFNDDFLAHWLQRKGAALYTKKKERGKSVGDRRWITIPESPESESQLYDPFFNLISKVLKDLLKHGRERKVYDTHDKQLPHFEEHHSSPDIVVRGIGSSFEMPSNGKPVGYSNMVTFFEIKLDRELTKDATLEQVAVYSRYAPCHSGLCPIRFYRMSLVGRFSSTSPTGGSFAASSSVRTEPNSSSSIALALSSLLSTTSTLIHTFSWGCYLA
jgi:hypothetical protein